MDGTDVRLGGERVQGELGVRTDGCCQVAGNAGFRKESYGIFVSQILSTFFFFVLNKPFRHLQT